MSMELPPGNVPPVNGFYLSPRTSGALLVTLRVCDGGESGPSRPHKHEHPTNYGFWNPPYVVPWDQDVRSLYLCNFPGAPSEGLGV